MSKYREIREKRNRSEKGYNMKFDRGESPSKTTGRMKAIAALSLLLVIMLCASGLSSLFADTDSSKLAATAVGVRGTASGDGAQNVGTKTEVLESDTTFWEVSLGGKPVALMTTEQDAKDIIQYIVKKYNDDESASVSIEPAMTVSEKQYKKGDALPEVTKDGVAVAEKLLRGNEKSVEYVIKEGDTLWDIAYEHDVDIDTLVSTNPGLDIENIHPGDKLVLLEGKADVEVRVITESKEDVEIEFETEYEDSEDLAEGEEVVLTEGENGIKTVTVRTVKVNGVVKLQEETSPVTKKEPVTQVIMRGISSAEDESSSEELEETSVTESDTESYTEESSDGDITESYSEEEVSYSGTKQAIVDAAYAQLGIDQDCTSLVSNSLAAAGINFHSGPMGYTSLGSWTSNPEPGDICIYDTHVAIYIGGGQAVHGGWWGDGYRTTAVWSVYTSWPTFIGYIHLDL